MNGTNLVRNILFSISAITINIINCKLYLPNSYDPLLPAFKKQAKTKDAEIIELIEDKDKLTSLYNAHNHFNSELAYGDFRITSWTAEGRELKQDIDDLIENIKNLLEESHPSILALQAVKNRVIKEVKENIVSNKLHYSIVLDDEGAIDAKTGGKKFLPIIYDNLVLKLHESGYLNKGEKTGPTVSYAIFEYLLPSEAINPNNKRFAIINMDIFQSDVKVVNVKYFTMLQKIKTHASLKQVGNLFIMGGIGNTDKHIKDSLKEYIDLIDRDVNNKDLSNTTVHGGNNNNDNIRRHYILLKDKDNSLQLNTGRILSGLKIGFNYPLEATLSFKKK